MDSNGDYDIRELILQLFFIFLDVIHMNGMCHAKSDAHKTRQHDKKHFSPFSLLSRQNLGTSSPP